MPCPEGQLQNMAGIKEIHIMDSSLTGKKRDVITPGRRANDSRGIPIPLENGRADPFTDPVSHNIK
jgi:hypothetical protein